MKWARGVIMWLGGSSLGVNGGVARHVSLKRLIGVSALRLMSYLSASRRSASAARRRHVASAAASCLFGARHRLSARRLLALSSAASRRRLIILRRSALGILSAAALFQRSAALGARSALGIIGVAAAAARRGSSASASAHRSSAARVGIRHRRRVMARRRRRRRHHKHGVVNISLRLAWRHGSSAYDSAWRRRSAARKHRLYRSRRSRWRKYVGIGSARRSRIKHGGASAKTRQYFLALSGARRLASSASARQLAHRRHLGVGGSLGAQRLGGALVIGGASLVAVMAWRQ